MSKYPLKRIKRELYHYVDGERVLGTHSKITGDVSEICGNVTDIIGDVSEIWGNVSNVCGNCDEIPLSARPCDINNFVEKEISGDE